MTAKTLTSHNAMDQLSTAPYGNGVRMRSASRAKKMIRSSICLVFKGDLP